MRCAQVSKRLLFAFLGVLAFLVFIIPTFALQTHSTYFALPSGPGTPGTGIFLHNPAKKRVLITLTAFNERGDLLAQIPVKLRPFETKALFPGENGKQLPKETAGIVAESPRSFVGFTVFGSLDKPLEILPATGTASQTLDFPHLGQGDNSWTRYFLFNPNAVSTPVTFHVFDKDGALLAEAPIFPLSPQETRAIPTEELFNSSLLPFVAVVRAVAEAPVSGFELIGSPQGEDVATLSGLSSPNTQLSFPIISEAENGTELGTSIRLFNGGTSPAFLTVEAFDAEGNSLGTVPDVSSLAPMASVSLATKNTGGSLPEGTSSLEILSDQPLSGYAVLEAIYGGGLTAVPGTARFDLIGSDDGSILATVPVLATEDGGTQEVFGDLGARYWKKRDGQLQASQLLALRSELDIPQKSIVTQQTISSVLTGSGVPFLTLPFTVGETWYVCQGYNGPISHKKAAALDLSIDSNSAPVGGKGCNPATAASSAKKPIFAPADGTVKAHFRETGSVNDMLCLELKGPDGKPAIIMKIGHLTNMLRVGAKFKRNDRLGIVEDPAPGNDKYAHIHIQLNDLSKGCSKAPTIPFSGTYQFEGAPNMTYDGSVNQWRGTVLTRSSVGTNSAQLIPSASSITASPGGSISFSITAKNTGSSTWSETTLHRLGWLSGFNGFGNVPADKRYRLNAGETIAPNASRTWTINVSAPTTPGTYPIVFQMVQDHVQWFGNTVTINVSVSSTLTITTASLPGSTAGSSYNATLGAAGGTLPYSWSLVSGSLPSGLTLSTGGVISGTPTSAGTFSFTVQVRDRSFPAQTAQRTFSITVQPQNQPPAITSLTANPTTVTPGGSSTITVSASDPENDPLTYTWTSTGGGLSPTTGPGPVTWSAPRSPGIYTVTVSVTDSKPGHSLVSRSVNISVQQNHPPVARFTMASGAQSAQENQTLTLTVPPGATANVSFSASRSSDPDGSITAYRWQINGDPVSPSRDFSFSLGRGTHAIFLTVTDNQGATGSVGGTVVVNEQAQNQPPVPRIDMTASSGQRAQENQVLDLGVPPGGQTTVTFSAARSSDPDGSITAYEWKIDGQVVNTLQTFSRTFSARPSAYQIFLTVQDNRGERRSVGASVQVTETQVSYQAHVAGLGWLSWVQNGQTAGTTGQSRQMEALKVTTSKYSIQYQAHVQNIGWQTWVSNGAVAGTTGQGLRMEAVKIQLQNAPANLRVCYRAHVAYIGWQGWVCDGAMAGTTGQGRAIEAIEIKIQ